MPGPRLQVRTSNPQPIVTTFSNAAETQGITQLGQLAVSGAELVQDSNDKDTLAAVSDKLQTVSEGVDQGIYTTSQAASLSAKIRNDALQNGNEHLMGELDALGNRNSRLFAIQRGTEATVAAREVKKQDDLARAYSTFNIDSNDPQAWSKLEVAQRLNQELGAAQQKLALMQTGQSIEKIQVKDVAFKFSNSKSNDLSNAWDKGIGRDTKAFESRSIETVNRMKGQILNDLLVMEQELTTQFGDRLNNDEIADMMVVTNKEAQYRLDLLDDKTSFETYSKRNALITAMADNILAPTTQAKGLNTLTDKIANSRNYDWLLTVVGNRDTVDLLQGNMGATMARLTGSDKFQGSTALGFIENKKDVAKVTANLLNAFTTQPVDLEDDTAVQMANTLANITAPIDLNPEVFDIVAWDALMEFGSSANGKATMADPKFTAAKASISRGLVNYADQLFTAAINELPEGFTISVSEDIIDIVAGSTRPTTGRVQDSTIVQEFASKRKREQWLENYGSRINKLAQTSSNVLGGTAHENLTSIASKFGLVSDINPVLNANEPTADEQLAAEIAVEQGWYPDIKSALSGISNE